MNSGSITEYVLIQLEADDRYKNVLSGTQDENAKKQIDITVKTFTREMAGVFDSFIKSLEDNPDLKAKFQSRYKK